MPAFALETLNEYERLANELLASSDKPAVERAARVLALYVGHYQMRYGPIKTAALAIIDSASPSGPQIADRAEAMRVLAAALTVAAVTASDADDERPERSGR
ncbi:MAG: hypothetical protein ACXWUS_14680 [Burkholderiales bacterium]